MDINLFEYGEKVRDRGMDIAISEIERDRPDFEQVIINTLRRIAKRQATVHCNDLYLEIFEPGTVRRPDNFNCMGSIWRRCSNPKTGFLLMTDKTVQCVDPLKHRHRSPQYLSLLFTINAASGLFHGSRKSA